MVAIILTVVVAVAVGVLLERRANAAAHRLRTLALQTMLWALAPFAVYVNVARAELTVDAGLAIAIAFAAIAAAGALTWRLGSGPLALARPSAGAAVISTIQANTGYLGLPLCAALFTHAELAQAIAYDAIVTMPMFAIGAYGVGAVLGHAGAASRGQQLRAGIARNPVLLALLAGLLVPEAWAPEALVTPSRLAIYALLPLGFFVVGVTLGDEAQDGTLRVPPPLTPPVAVVSAVRLLFVPAVLLLAGALLIDVPAPYYLLAAMPVGVNTVVVAHATGLDLRLASASIAWTTTIALAAVVVLALVGVL